MYCTTAERSVRPAARAASWRLATDLATKSAVHMLDTISPSASSPQTLIDCGAARRHEDRDVGAGAIVELHSVAAVNIVPEKRHLVAAQQSRE